MSYKLKTRLIYFAQLRYTLHVMLRAIRLSINWIVMKPRRNIICFDPIITESSYISGASCNKTDQVTELCSRNIATVDTIQHQNLNHNSHNQIIRAEETTSWVVPLTNTQLRRRKAGLLRVWELLKFQQCGLQKRATIIVKPKRLRWVWERRLAALFLLNC